MSTSAELDIRKFFKVPSNRYLRHQHTKKRDSAIFTFLMDIQTYGFKLAKVIETLHNPNVIKVADFPKHIAGVFKYKHFILPLINLRQYLKLTGEQNCSESDIVILKINQKFIGIMVESISSIVSHSDIKLHTLPDTDLSIDNIAIGNLAINTLAIDSQYLLGVAKTRERDVVLVDIEKLLAKDNLLSKQEAAKLDAILDLMTEMYLV